MKYPHPTICGFMILNVYIYNEYNQPQYLRLHLFSWLSICHHPLPCFSEHYARPASLLDHFKDFYNILYHQLPPVSSGHFKHIGLSIPKIISLYLIMVSWMNFLSSFSVSVQFQWGIFNYFAFSSNFFLLVHFFVTLNYVTKVFIVCF